MTIEEWWAEVKKQASNQGFSAEDLIIDHWVTYFYRGLPPGDVISDMNEMWHQ
jgi:predicted DNA-binding transcriptional regulator